WKACWNFMGKAPSPAFGWGLGTNGNREAGLDDGDGVARAVHARGDAVIEDRRALELEGLAALAAALAGGPRGLRAAFLRERVVVGGGGQRAHAVDDVAHGVARGVRRAAVHQHRAAPVGEVE